MIKIRKYVLAFLLAEIILGIFLLTQYRQKRKIYITGQTEQIQRTMTTGIAYYRDVSNYFYYHINEDSRFHEILGRLEDRQNIKHQTIRDDMIRYFDPTHEDLKMLGFSGMSVQLPGGISFLRMDRPELYGDDLYDLRYSIRRVQSGKTPVSGYENGRTKTGFRFLYPLVRDSALTASIEFVVPTTAIESYLRKNHGGYFAFMLDKSTIFNPDEPHVRSSCCTPPFADYLLLNKTTGLPSDYIHPANTENFNAYLSARISENIDHEKHFSMTWKHYLILGIPFYSIKGTFSGYLIASFAQEFLSELKISSLTSFILFSALIAGLLVTVKISRNRMYLINRSLEKTNVRLRRKDRILQSVSSTAEKFLRNAKWETLIDEVLKDLGESMEVSRIYIFKNHPGHNGTRLFSQIYEWVNNGITQQVGNADLQNISYSDGFERWREQLEAGKAVYGAVRTFPPNERAILESQEIISLLVVPIYSGSRWWGFIGFDECTYERNWSQGERDILKTAADILGSAILRQEYNRTQEIMIHDLGVANTELKNFTYITSHDLKTPLRGIHTLANWIAMDYGDKLDENGKESLNLLIKRVHRMDRLLDGIGKYARIGQLPEKKSEISLDELLKSIQTSLNLPSGFHIRRLTPLPSVIYDPRHAEEIFRELIENAIRFHNNPDQGEIRISCLDKGDFWEFAVSDNGPGIHEKYHEKIFGIFQTLDPKDLYENTGVGLTIIRKIIEFNGGEIRIKSSPGEGTAFFFTIRKNGES